MPKIALYGGAFNPPHLDHVKVVTCAAAMQPFQEVWIMPSWNHAFGKQMLPFQDRLELLRLATQDILDPSVFKVVDLERVYQTTYTIDLIERLQSVLPEVDFTLVLGEDNLEVAPRWHRWEDLQSKVEILWVPTQGSIRSTVIREAARARDWRTVQTLVHHRVVTWLQHHPECFDLKDNT